MSSSLWTVEERARSSKEWHYLGTFSCEAEARIYVIRVRAQWKGQLSFRVVQWVRK